MGRPALYLPAASLTPLLPAHTTHAPLDVPSHATPLASDGAFWERHAELRALGRGCFGSVLLVRRRAGDAVLAAKVVARFSDGPGSSCAHEATLLHGLRHPHIITLVETYVSPHTLFLTMEAELGGDLYARAQAAGGMLGEPETRAHLRGVLRALSHLHALGIVHRDLKASNVMLSAAGVAKLGDFGLAARLPEGGLLTSVCGTHDFLAPEMIRCGHGDCAGYGAAVDAWAAGLLLYSLLYGASPFARETDVETLQCILRGEVGFPAAPAVGADAQRVVASLLVVDPAGRASADGALRAAWLAAASDEGGAAAPILAPGVHRRALSGEL